MVKHLNDRTMGALTDVQNVGGVVGFHADTLPDDHRQEIERVLDEIFERGYQAGYSDAKECQ